MHKLIIRVTPAAAVFALGIKLPYQNLISVKRNMNISQSKEISVSNEADDGELFEVMAGGCETGLAAFGVFYSRYAKGLHKRTCRIEGLAKADRKDFVQETMLRAYRFAHKFKPPDIHR